jgi:hypothetical protein
VRPRDQQLSATLSSRLQSFDERKHRLPGIRSAAAQETFLEQLLESTHRVRYIEVIRDRPLSNLRMDPDSELFDPFKAAILKQRAGELEEAFWLVFLFVHFGKNSRGGWRYAREVYGRVGESGIWDWKSVSANPARFRKWLEAHKNFLRRQDPPGGFGNHRKYESLSNTGAAVETYVNLVGPPRTHAQLVAEAVQRANGNPRQAFDDLYRSMAVVTRFGRMARFDYLTMLGKLGLAPIEPGLTYMQDATGPKSGAQLLFGGKRTRTAAELEKLVGELEADLRVGMQVMEDALCNWHKSPRKLIRFRG